MENSSDLRMEAVKKNRSAEMELPLIKYHENSFDEAAGATNEELSAARLGCAALRWNPNEVLLRLIMLETDSGESLRSVSEQATDGFFMMSKLSETEVVRTFERIIAISSLRRL